MATNTLFSPPRTRSSHYLGPIEDIHASDRAKRRQRLWDATKVTLSMIGFVYFMVQVYAILFMGGCNHNACVLPDSWPAWLTFPAKLFIGFLKAIAASYAQ
jgi:hypothetical protein